MQVQKYPVDKYPADICNSLVNQTLWSQGAYPLEIISARSGRSGQLPTQILFWGIDRFCWLLIGVKPTSEMCQCNRNHNTDNSKHVHLLASTFIHLTSIKALFLHLKGWFDTNQQSTKSVESLKEFVQTDAYNLQLISTLRPKGSQDNIVNICSIFCIENRPDILQLEQKSSRYFCIKKIKSIFLYQKINPIFCNSYKNRVDIFVAKNITPVF